MFPHSPLHSFAYQYSLNTNLLDVVFWCEIFMQFVCISFYFLFSYSVPPFLSPLLPFTLLSLFIYLFINSLDFKCEETIGQIQIEGYSTKTTGLGFRNANVTNDKRL